jgi:hypothetical protein
MVLRTTLEQHHKIRKKNHWLMMMNVFSSVGPTRAWIIYNIWMSCIGGIQCVLLTPKKIVEGVRVFEFKLLGVKIH